MALSTPHAFTFDYDAEGDVLYVSLAEPQAALSVEVEPDVLLRYVPPHLQVVGITFLNFRRRFPDFDPTHTPSWVDVVVEDCVRKYPTVPGEMASPIEVV